MKNPFKGSVTLQVTIFLLKLIAAIIAVSISFWLMNMANTIAFIVGILLGVGSIVFYFEHLFHHYIKKTINKKE